MEVEKFKKANELYKEIEETDRVMKIFERLPYFHKI